MQVRGGHLEGSNVSAVEEMVATMSLNRDFEVQMKLFKAADDMADQRQPADARVNTDNPSGETP